MLARQTHRSANCEQKYHKDSDVQSGNREQMNRSALDENRSQFSWQHRPIAEQHGIGDRSHIIRDCSFQHRFCTVAKRSSKSFEDRRTGNNDLDQLRLSDANDPS